MVQSSISGINLIKSRAHVRTLTLVICKCIGRRPQNLVSLGPDRPTAGPTHRPSAKCIACVRFWYVNASLTLRSRAVFSLTIILWRRPGCVPRIVAVARTVPSFDLPLASIYTDIKTKHVTPRCFGEVIASPRIVCISCFLRHRIDASCCWACGAINVRN